MWYALPRLGRCPHGWHGERCELDVDECSSTPCKNGGSCNTPRPDFYSCACDVGWEGEHCTGQLVWGCMMPDALNYNPVANVDTPDACVLRRPRLASSNSKTLTLIDL